MATINWKVEQMTSYPTYSGKSDVVFNVGWKAICDDGGHLGYSFGTQIIELDPSAPFTPYKDLTEDQVIEWVKSSLGEDGVIKVEAEIQEMINLSKNPPVVTYPLPWATNMFPVVSQ